MRTEIIGDATLMLGDCREILPTIEYVDCLVTDPPYGIDIAANPVRQKYERSSWDATTPEASLFDLMMGRAKWQVVWGGNYFDLPPSQCFFVWDKVQPQEFTLSMCEQAWTNIKGPAKLFRRRVVSYAKEHPTQKPVELMKWCIDLLPFPNRAILDPFMGAGTTGVAAAMRGKRFLGIEREPKYFDIAVRRIEAAYAQPDLFVPRPSHPKPVQEALL